jgi:hypothetical protein
MRLNEFADPKEYTPPVTEAEDYLKQLHRILPDRSAEELAPSTLSIRRQPPSKPGQLSDTRSIRGHVGGDRLRSRRGAGQRPAA